MSKNKKTTLAVTSDLRDSMKRISKKSGKNIERLTADALKKFIYEYEKEEEESK